MTGRRSRGNAKLKSATYNYVPPPERKWTPIRLPERPETEVVHLGSGALYETETILIANDLGIKETQSITLNRRPTVIDGWLHDDETYFERRHIRVIEHARDLWRAVSMHADTPVYIGARDTRGLEVENDDELAARAFNLLRRARSLVPRWQWDMFENVVRWNEPYGFPGSHLYGDKPKRREWARSVVRSTAETISRSLFL